MRRSPLVNLGRIRKYSIRYLNSVFNTRVLWSRHMILLDKDHQDVHKVDGFFPQWSHQVRYLSKALMESFQKSVEAWS
jgi:hypothetical protein